MSGSYQPVLLHRLLDTVAEHDNVPLANPTLAIRNVYLGCLAQGLPVEPTTRMSVPL
jgi:hypothetical protein